MGVFMLLRAVFWIGLVSLLMPHEPDLGFGRPGAAAAAAPPSSLRALVQSDGSAQNACSKDCGLSILGGFQSIAMRSMDEVRADLEAHRSHFH
jgi:hypothetical protein